MFVCYDLNESENVIGENLANQNSTNLYKRRFIMLSTVENKLITYNRKLQMQKSLFYTTHSEGLYETYPLVAALNLASDLVILFPLFLYAN